MKMITLWPFDSGMEAYPDLKIVVAATDTGWVFSDSLVNTPEKQIINLDFFCIWLMAINSSWTM